MKQNLRPTLVILFLAFSLWLVACQTRAEPRPIAQVQEPAAVGTPVPEPTAVIVPTSTPVPEATATTAPTAEPTVEPTIEPTPGPVELVLSITGDAGDPLNDPSGMALDAQGNLYVADTLNHRIRYSTATGNC